MADFSREYFTQKRRVVKVAKLGLLGLGVTFAILCIRKPQFYGLLMVFFVLSATVIGIVIASTIPTSDEGNIYIEFYVESNKYRRTVIRADAVAKCYKQGADEVVIVFKNGDTYTVVSTKPGQRDKFYKDLLDMIKKTKRRK